MSAGYQPHSVDAMFSRVMNRLDNQDHSYGEHRAELNKRLDEILAEQRKTNGRVSALEREKWTQRGFVAALSIGATTVWHYITKR